MSTIKANTLLHSDGSTTTQPSIPALDQRMAKAWVNFNGTGTVAINESYYVSSITDLAGGLTKVTFLSSMPSSNYTGVVSSANGSSDAGNADYMLTSGKINASCDIRTMENGTLSDSHDVNVIIFGA